MNVAASCKDRRPSRLEGFVDLNELLKTYDMHKSFMFLARRTWISNQTLGAADSFFLFVFWLKKVSS